MTTSALAAPSSQTRRPLPWRRLSWVVWRRYRTTLGSIVALVGLVAVYVLIRGHQMRSAYAAAQSCTPPSAASCRFGFENFHNTYVNIGVIGGMLLWVPAVIGAFAGAPLLARELETGTFRYAWTQGMGRMRWVLAHVVPGALGVVIISLVLGGLITWYDHPLVDSGIEQRLHASEFPLTGVAVAGWGLAAYAIGVLAGLISRRVLAALAITLAGWTGLAFLADGVFRPHYLAPLATRRLQLPVGDLPIQQWWTSGGVRVSTAQLNQAVQAIGVHTGDGSGNFQVGPRGTAIDPVQYLLQHGYVQWTSYQPDNRYWSFQWIEFGWLAALSLLLLAATIWMVCRRAT